MYEKLKHEIVATYIKENNINMKKGKYNVSELTHDVNAIFFKCLDSYYFENHTKNAFVKSIDSNQNDYYYVVTLPNAKNKKNKIKHCITNDEMSFFEEYLAANNQNAFSKISNKKALETKSITLSIGEAVKILPQIKLAEYPVVSDIFSSEYDMMTDEPLKHFPIEAPYNNKRESIDIEFNQKINKTIDRLKEDPIFNMLLTDDSIQQLLNLKNKNNIEFKTIETGYYNTSGVTDMLKFENSSYCNATLMNHYSLNYFPQNKDKQYTAIVAHNDFEIAGIIGIIDSNTYNEYPEKFASYISFIEVGEQFYGRQLGIQLMKEAIEYARKEDLILFMTPYSDNGSTYIHQKINELAKTSGVIIISEYEKKAAVKAINKYKDLPKSELKSKLADVLDFMRANYKELDLDNYNVKDDIETYINKSDKPTKKSTLKIT
jgi:hypothetical protein